MLQLPFKGISRKFEGYFKKVSRKFQKKVSRVFQECFNTVLLHGSHCSYPSRRRVCFSKRLQDSFKGISWKFQGCFKRFSRGIREVLRDL